MAVIRVKNEKEHMLNNRTIVHFIRLEYAHIRNPSALKYFKKFLSIIIDDLQVQAANNSGGTGILLQVCIFD